MFPIAQMKTAWIAVVAAAAVWTAGVVGLAAQEGGKPLGALPAGEPKTPAKDSDTTVVSQGSNARVVLSVLGRKGVRVVQLGRPRNLTVPAEFRYKPVDGRKLVEEIARSRGLQAIWLQDKSLAVLQRGASDAEVSGIAAGLKSTDPAKQREAAWHAGWVEDHRVIHLLLEAAGKADDRLSRQVTASLLFLGTRAVAAVGGEQARPVLDRGFAIFEKQAKNVEGEQGQSAIPMCLALRDFGGDRAVPILEKILNDAPPNCGVPKFVCEALENIAGDKAVPVLERVLATNNYFHNMDAARALGVVATDQAFAALQKLAASPDWRARKAAPLGMALIGNDPAIAVLEKLAWDTDWQVRYAACDALGQIGGEKALAILEKFGRDPEVKKLMDRVAESKRARPNSGLSGPGEVIQRNLLLARGQIGDDKALAFIAKAADDPAAMVRHKVAEALGWMGVESVLPILEKLAADADPAVGYRAAASLAQIGTDGALAILERLAASRDEAVRSRIASALGDSDGPKAAELLEKLAMDVASAVRRTAVTGLAAVRGDKAVPLLGKLADDEDHLGVRQSVGFALRRIGGDQAFPILKKLAEDPEKRARSAAIMALGDFKRIGGYEALAILKAHAENDPEQPIRKAATQALKNLETEF